MNEKIAVLAVAVLAVLVFSMGVNATPMGHKNAWVSSIEKNNIDKGNNVDRIDFILYKSDSTTIKSNAATSAKQTSPSCYALSGQKLQTIPIKYVINPVNPQGLSDSFFVSAVFASANAWDAATSKALFKGYTVDNSAQFAVRDNKNSISFKSLPGSGIIGGTTAWFDPTNHYILEFDTFLNSDYNFGDATKTSNVMDVQDIVTHELGHALGLGDIYEPSCYAVTMFGSSSIGETAKRTLEKADITGLQKIYGK